MKTEIDTTFDFMQDTPPGKDPDQWSATLKRYHQALWSKPLPSGPTFDLREERGAYLVYEGKDRTTYPCSDAITTTMLGRAAHLVQQIPTELLPEDLGYTMGSSCIFPGERIDKKMTINGARGFHPRIADRFDLTLECIRRHYLGDSSPLSAVLMRYDYFFELFVDFDGYVDFFLLQDFLGGPGAINFFLPFSDFDGGAVPGRCRSISTTVPPATR